MHVLMIKSLDCHHQKGGECECYIHDFDDAKEESNKAASKG